jgi:hypothetical protein
MRRTLCVALLSLGFAASTLDAQAASPQNRFGIGVSLTPLVFLGDPDAGPIAFAQTVILLPIRNGAMLFEPEIGFVRASTEETNPGGTQETSVSLLRIGIGLLMETGEREQLRPYIGARLGAVRSEQEFSASFGDSEFKQNGWYAAAIAGAQHYFTTHFSLGGEVQLMRSSQNLEGDSAGDASNSMFATQAVMTVRWYF